GVLMVTADQNIAFELAAGIDPATVRSELSQIGYKSDSREDRVKFRICPGSHECIMGLVLTRDTARIILAAMGAEAEALSWAISGCPNSCSQPQLADFGVVVSKLVPGDDGQRSPRYDIYRSEKDGLGKRTEKGLTLE